jgi:NTP pyrophosphatase (non-canonical NTP hydrolase)
MTPDSVVSGKPEGIPSELADVMIRILDMAEAFGINLQEVMLEKHEYNKTRGYRHGGKVA